MKRSPCQWPGCDREKAPGKGHRYCVPHQLVGTVKEVRRKRRAAGESRLRQSEHLGPRDDTLSTPSEAAHWREYRCVLKEFGLK